MASDGRDDRHKGFELLGCHSVVGELGGEFLGDEEAVGPGEGLPDGFGDEGGEGVEENEDVFEGGLEEGDVFVDFLAF